MFSISNEDLAYIQRISSELAEKQHKNMGFNHVQSKPIVDFEDSDEIKAQNYATPSMAQFNTSNSVNRVDEILQGFETSINDDFNSDSTSKEHTFHAVTPKEAHLNKIKAEKALKMRKKQQKERLQQHRDELFKPIYTSETESRPQQPLFQPQQQQIRQSEQSQTQVYAAVEQFKQSQTKPKTSNRTRFAEAQTLLEQANMVVPQQPKPVKSRENKPKTAVKPDSNKPKLRPRTQQKTQAQSQVSQNTNFQSKISENTAKNRLKPLKNGEMTLDMLIERLIALKSQVLGSTPIFVDGSNILKVVNNGENITISTKKEG